MTTFWTGESNLPWREMADSVVKAVNTSRSTTPYLANAIFLRIPRFQGTAKRQLRKRQPSALQDSSDEAGDMESSRTAAKRHRAEEQDDSILNEPVDQQPSLSLVKCDYRDNPSPIFCQHWASSSGSWGSPCPPTFTKSYRRHSPPYGAPPSTPRHRRSLPLYPPASPQPPRWPPASPHHLALAKEKGFSVAHVGLLAWCQIPGTVCLRPRYCPLPFPPGFCGWGKDQLPWVGLCGHNALIEDPDVGVPRRKVLSSQALKSLQIEETPPSSSSSSSTTNCSSTTNTTASTTTPHSSPAVIMASVAAQVADLPQNVQTSRQTLLDRIDAPIDGTVISEFRNLYRYCHETPGLWERLLTVFHHSLFFFVWAPTG
ncbi:hypothetical protein QBC39DRAFT_399482 [Podospora conica]|nr:hypothetical protein QBC39DRAFT_399482 [Schizothecium conicum]